MDDFWICFGGLEMLFPALKGDTNKNNSLLFGNKAAYSEAQV